MVRVLQIAVVALWLVTTGWLIRSTWFPDESRFATVEVREVLDAMFVNWNDAADMIIMENGREVGRLSVSASNAIDAATKTKMHNLSITGALSDFGVLANPGIDGEGEDEGGGAGEIIELKGSKSVARRDRLIVRSLVGLDNRYGFTSGELTLRFPQREARVDLAYEKASKQLGLRLTIGGMPLLNYTGDVANLRSALPGSFGMGLGFGFPFPMPALAATAETPDFDGAVDGDTTPMDFIGGLLSGGDAQTRLAGIRPQLSAKFGHTRIAGQPMAVYLLLLTVSGEGIDPAISEKAIRIYIGEEGRPVMIDTPFEYQAIAEVLAPGFVLQTPMNDMEAPAVSGGAPSKVEEKSARD